MKQKELYNIGDKISKITSKLIKLGMEVQFTVHSGFYIYFNWIKNEKLLQEVIEDYPFGPPQSVIVLVALAEVQEIRNNFIDEEEIILINEFFGFSSPSEIITQAKINKAGKYF